MTNKPKAKGTALESAVVLHAISRGIEARRVTLHGRYDQGDVHVIADDGSLVVIECKNTPNRLDLSGALAELAAEKENAGAMLGAVVFKRKGTTDVGRYYAVLELDDLLAFLGPQSAEEAT